MTNDVFHCLVWRTCRLMLIIPPFFCLFQINSTCVTSCVAGKQIFKEMHRFLIVTGFEFSLFSLCFTERPEHQHEAYVLSCFRNSCSTKLLWGSFCVLLCTSHCEIDFYGFHNVVYKSNPLKRIAAKPEKRKKNKKKGSASHLVFVVFKKMLQDTFTLFQDLNLSRNNTYIKLTS